MSDELVRFSVAVPESLLERFDRLVAKRGAPNNRSEAVRDLIRFALERDECEDPDAQVMATLTIVYDHHTNDLKDRLDGIQHSNFENVVSTLHVHLDHHTCLETIILKGSMGVVKDISNQILGMKGVKTGGLTCTTIGNDPACIHQQGSGPVHSHDVCR